MTIFTRNIPGNKPKTLGEIIENAIWDSKYTTVTILPYIAMSEIRLNLIIVNVVFPTAIELINIAKVLDLDVRNFEVIE